MVSDMSRVAARTETHTQREGEVARGDTPACLEEKQRRESAIEREREKEEVVVEAGMRRQFIDRASVAAAAAAVVVPVVSVCLVCACVCLVARERGRVND